MAILKFIKLASQRRNSIETYFEFQRFQAQNLIKELYKYGLSNATKILDIGSGIGGYIYELAKTFPNAIIFALDLNPLEFTINKTKNISNIKIIRGDGMIMPFKENTFDFVLASSVIEHVGSQENFISEMKRVCKKNGICYISFPPYYSPVGGHDLSPFHYLPGNLPLIIYSKKVKFGCESFKNYGLVKTTIMGIEKLTQKNFTILDIKPRIFYFLKPIAKIPIIREFLIHHVEFILKNDN
jgi:SAM-dependent methyltransferase